MGDTEKHKNAGSPRRYMLQGLCVVLGIAVLVFAVYQIGRQMELSQFQNGETRGDIAQRFASERTIEYEGRTYQYNESLLSILLMGIDQSAENANGAGFRSGGQADFLMLLVFDPRSKSIERIQIDRDTMTEISILGVLGNVTGTRTAQICLSHGFGDGKEKSGEYTVTAVKKLLGNIDINYYISVNLDAIPVLNEWLGGVTVKIADDFSKYDAAMVPGAQLTLRGNQAEIYVRSRIDIGEGTNEARMARQRQYMGEATRLLTAKLSKDPSSIGEIYDMLGENLVSNMKRVRMINEARQSMGFAQADMRKIEGTYQLGADGFMEFYPDEKALEQLVLETFYQPVGG